MNDYEWEDRTKLNHSPSFKNAKTYADAKIKMLRHDFCVNLSEEDEVFIRRFDTEWGINNACRVILNKYWN